jgi:hypothetical protein
MGSETWDTGTESKQHGSSTFTVRRLTQEISGSFFLYIENAGEFQEAWNGYLLRFELNECTEIL